MAVPYHTHSFDIPAATKEDVVAGVSTDKVVTPSSLGSAAIRKVEDFATAEQGKKASTAIQKSDLSSVATTGSYHDLKDQPALGSAAAKDASAFATAAQGHKADTAVQSADMQKSLDGKLDKKGGKIDGDFEVKGNINFEGDALTIANSVYVSASLGITNKIYGWGSGKTLEIDTITGDISGSVWGNGKLSDYLKVNTVSPKDLGALARKDKVAVSDIDAQGKLSDKLFLSGDGKWKEPPGGGNIEGDLKVSESIEVGFEVIAKGSVIGRTLDVALPNDDGSSSITGSLINGGDISGYVWGKDEYYGKLSDYLKEHIPKAYAIVDKDNKVVSIADGLHNVEVAGLRVVGVPEEPRMWDVRPISFDVEKPDVGEGESEEVSPSQKAFFPELSNWRLHAAIDLEKGLRDRFNAAITRMPAAKQAISRAKLARKPVFQRHDPLFEELLADPKFGLNEDQFDTFWKNATILN